MPMAVWEALSSIMIVYLLKKLLLIALKEDKASTEVLMKYNNFANVF